ncbi:hypothetical protein HaLaN_24841 [Haematococcus lacustris]|uniref:Uncharacterized protein n=1 Tax=Haematococcus lacustris TaxID=44745 RepID=A0A699ZZB3_HAELA|nr:hypothetical protein HaLaN_24841 [Haematococcus lacustris]
MLLPRDVLKKETQAPRLPRTERSRPPGRRDALCATRHCDSVHQAADVVGSGQRDQGQGQALQEVIGQRRQVIEADLRGVAEAAGPDINPAHDDRAPWSCAAMRAWRLCPPLARDTSRATSWSMTGCPRAGSGCNGLQSTAGILMAELATTHMA